MFFKCLFQGIKHSLTLYVKPISIQQEHNLIKQAFYPNEKEKSMVIIKEGFYQNEKNKYQQLIELKNNIFQYVNEIQINDDYCADILGNKYCLCGYCINQKNKGHHYKTNFVLLQINHMDLIKLHLF